MQVILALEEVLALIRGLHLDRGVVEVVLAAAEISYFTKCLQRLV